MRQLPKRVPAWGSNALESIALAALLRQAIQPGFLDRDMLAELLIYCDYFLCVRIMNGSCFEWPHELSETYHRGIVCFRNFRRPTAGSSASPATGRAFSPAEARIKCQVKKKNCPRFHSTSIEAFSLTLRILLPPCKHSIFSNSVIHQKSSLVSLPHPCNELSRRSLTT